MNPSDETPNEYHSTFEDLYYNSEHEMLLGEKVIKDFIRGFQHAMVVKEKHLDSNQWDDLKDAFSIEWMEIGQKEHDKGTFNCGAYLQGYSFGAVILDNKISKADYDDYTAQYESYKESFWDNRPDIDNLLDDHKNSK
tara:strand:+ start:167 stop:580 length:414 start_codon:yes stop_codon:yes gene_type:complete